MEKVQLVISEIHEKIARLKTSMDRVESENETLSKELDMLKEKLAKSEREVQDFRVKYDSIKGQLEDSTVSDNGTNDEEIDFLVREIDSCINRLKAE